MTAQALIDTPAAAPETEPSASFSQTAEAVLALYAAHGVDYVFINPGTDTSFRDGKRQGTVGGIAGAFDPSDVVARYILGGLNLLVDTDGSLAKLAGQGGDPTGNPASWASAYQQIWEKLYLSYTVVPTCNP